jgi:hypothetical protein
MLKRLLKNHEFNAIDGVEEEITKASDELTFDEVQNVFHNGIRRLAWLLRMGAS